MSDDWSGKGVSVPAGRLNRAARMGGLGAGVLGAMAAGGARALMAGQRPDARSLLLTPSNAKRFADELAKMRGAAMKMGQLLSMEAGDVLPPELAAVLARLRSDAHIMPPAQLKNVLRAEYGADFLRRFKRFDPRPVAAASIGQVHKAVTHDGRVLALKVQYPGVRRAIDADIANLGSLMRLSGMVPKGVALGPLLDEARRQLHEEADYRREAAELSHFCERLGADPGFVLPRPHADLSTDNILAMDFVDSVEIEHVAEMDQSTRDDVATRLFALMMREVFDWQRVQTDPNFANFRWQPEGKRIVLLDFGASRGFADALTQDLRVITQCALASDGSAVLARLQAMDVVPGSAPEGQMRLLREMIDMALEVFGRDVVDFGDTRFLAAMREAGMQLGSREEFRHIPPWDVLYIQRKLGGLVLLATRLRARAPIRALAQAHVTAPAREAG